MEGFIDTKRLNLEELMGIITLYPWYGGARKELCERMSKMGEVALSDSQFPESAMYVPSREIIAGLVRRAMENDMTDSQVESLVRSYELEKEAENSRKKEPVGRVYAGVGDYFSQEEYDQVRRDEDNVFSRYAAKARTTKPEVFRAPEEPVFDLYTETLAQIYAEQGYYEQAKDIYSKLILAYPEKNAYFAALIQKLDELN